MSKKALEFFPIIERTFETAMLEGDYQMAVHLAKVSGFKPKQVAQYVNQNLDKFGLTTVVAKKDVKKYMEKDLESNQFLDKLFDYNLDREPTDLEKSQWSQNLTDDGIITRDGLMNFIDQIVSPTSATTVVSAPTSSGIRELDKDFVASIDLRFDHKGDYTPDGYLVNSFENVKRHVDMAKKHGFTAIELDINVPINVETGELQLMTPEGTWNRDKSLPDDIWKIVSYAESKGLDTSLKIHIVNALDDTSIMSHAVGANFDVNKFFASVKSYETMIAADAQKNGVDQIIIGSMNFGFDTGYKSQWQDVISGIRSVYSGELGYESFYHDEGIVPWDLVDNIAVNFNPDLGSAKNSVADIVPLYLQTVDNNGWKTYNPYQTILNLDAKYAGKDIMLYGIAMSPIQTALNEDISVHDTVYKNTGALDLEKLDFGLLEKRYDGFFEFFGNYLDDKVDILQFWSFAPWADADWIKDPGNDTVSLALNAYARAGYFLNYQPETLDIIDDYLHRGWGANDLNFPDSNDFMKVDLVGTQSITPPYGD